MGLEPGTTKDQVRKCLENWDKGDNGILDLSQAYRLQARHRLADSARRAARPRLALHLRAAVGQRRVRHVPVIVEGRYVPWSLLVKDMPKEKHQDLDFIIGQLDWEKNVDTHFKEHNYLEPIVDKTASGDGYTDKWIVYGTVDGEQLFSAKELTLEPGAKCTIKDPGASGWITVQGKGRIGKLALQTPAMIRFGQETEDEVFITHEAADRRRRDREHRQRAAGRPALLRARRAQEAAEGGGLSGSSYECRWYGSLALTIAIAEPLATDSSDVTVGIVPIAAMITRLQRRSAIRMYDADVRASGLGTDECNGRLRLAILEVTLAVRDMPTTGHLRNNRCRH